MDYPLRHISLRVPWHDSGWAGTVCSAPQLNGACAKLKRIAGAKNDAAEQPRAGQSLHDLPPAEWPCCIDERSTFMASFELDIEKKHALAERNPEIYGHFEPTKQRYPAYSAGAVPFLWLMKPNIEEYADRYGIAIDESREPKLKYDTNWVHEASNQRELLDCFAGHLREEESLCLFYAKHVPFVEGTARVLVGVGRVKHKGKLMEYRRSREGMAGMIWERPIQHSIRPKGEDGFLMPYQELVKRAAEDTSIDLAHYAAHAPSEHWHEFSFGSELVTHDGAISALLSIDAALGRIHDDFGIDTAAKQAWLHDELVRLWKVRGPYPGLGAVLHAFGLSKGVFVAHALQGKAGENADPWPLVDKAFDAPASLLPKELQVDLKELKSTWKGLPAARRNTLRLLSRFELTVEQADKLYDEEKRGAAGWSASDQEILKNPYRIYEASRHDPDGVQLLTVDRGIFPDDAVRNLHPLPPPSALDSAVDIRRVRAFALLSLEVAASAGHTLEHVGDLATAIRDASLSPACPATSDILAANASQLAPEIVSLEQDGRPALQLDRYRAIRELVADQLLRRVTGQRHKVSVDWASVLESDKRFGKTADPEEKLARQEKAAALAELAASRFAILAGPAGAGKTTVLGLLCGQKDVVSDGLLLLAPTGKARVRMQELATGAGTKAQTIAQFLNQNGRYDVNSGRYHLSGRPKATGFGTVIVDEASMLTEDMLGALLDALQGVKRLILVGDPAQLPPIGAGRPFVDIIARLKPDDNERRFPRVAPGYAELIYERRQQGVDRPDLRLARWFSSTSPSPGEDDVFSADDLAHETIRFVEWEKPEDFQPKLLQVLIEELSLSGAQDTRGFNRSLGATVVGEYDYFNRSGKDKGAVASVEAWQVLSPLHSMPFGVGDINRLLHERFRASFIELASRPRGRSIPRPMGPERIVYGDKVINVANHRRAGRKVYPQEGALGYLANGEVGIAVGQWKTAGYPKALKVEFSSQQGYTYDFYGNDFSEEGEAKLELAYALTVHKAQGSQFKIVLLVLPEGHPIMSRELIYTSLTRHQDRIVLMHQGARAKLKDLAAMHQSETARRRTNLVDACRMQEVPRPKGSVFLQGKLIHRASNKLAVRSKSELLIAEAFLAASVAFEYEKPLTLGGRTRYPDFTIEDEISGRTFYWEHLGMLDRADYRAAWQKKLDWYRANGVLPLGEASGDGARLLTTQDTAKVGIDMAEVQRLIAIVKAG